MALAAVAPALATPPATKKPGELVVALSLPRPAFQVGAVRGGEVVLARGFEVAVARAVARRLGLRPRFLHVGAPRRLLAGGAKRWDVAIAQLRTTPLRSRRVAFSTAYLPADQAVLLRRGLSRPRRLGDLRNLHLCAERRTAGAGVIAVRIRPRRAPALVERLDTLLRRVQTGACDAAVAELGRLGPALSGRRNLYGAVAFRIETGAGYSFALERGSPLTPAVDDALRRLALDGTLRRLTKTWLGIDVPRLAVLQ